MADKTYIYLIGDRKTGLTKIGLSGNPRKRLIQLAHQSTLLPEPNDFFLREAFLGTYNEEQSLHKAYACLRVRGEWFQLCFDDFFTICDAFGARERLLEFQQTWEWDGSGSDSAAYIHDVINGIDPHLWDSKREYVN